MEAVFSAAALTTTTVIMSTTPKSAKPSGARSRAGRRRWLSLTGALLGWVLALSYLPTLGGLGALVGLLTAPRKAATAAPGYLDYDVWIEHRSGSTYRAKAWSGGAGFEATVDFTLPPALERGEPFRFAGADAVRGGPGDGEAESAGPGVVGEELFL